MAKSDKELLDEIARGNSDAFTVLYNRYWRLLYIWTSNRIFNRDAVQDLMQNVWADIWSNPGMIKVNDKGSAKSILLGFVSFRILDYFKKKNILVFQSKENEFSELEEGQNYSHVLEDLQLKEVHKIIDEILKKLPERARKIYIMSERNNLTVPEIAEKLSITEETVRRRLAWINSLLRKELKKCYFEDASIVLLLLYAKEFLK